MALLKSEPFAPVRSLAELFALAQSMEREAAERYAELAEKMRAQGSAALGAVFERLAAEERGHFDLVAQLSVSETGAPPQPAALKWSPPDALDVEGFDSTDPRLLSEYRALAVAVRNEERAFAFWSYVAAQAETAAVREAAERMARMELEHVSLLRQERRRFFHAQRKAPAAEATPIATLETLLAQRCEELASRLEGEEAASLMAIAAEARRTAEELRTAGLPAGGDDVSVSDVQADPLGLAELLVDRYLDAAQRASQEAALSRAQALAERAIVRLTRLRSNLPRPA